MEARGAAGLARPPLLLSRELSRDTASRANCSDDRGAAVRCGLGELFVVRGQAAGLGLLQRGFEPASSIALPTDHAWGQLRTSSELSTWAEGWIEKLMVRFHTVAMGKWAGHVPAAQHASLAYVPYCFFEPLAGAYVK